MHIKHLLGTKNRNRKEKKYFIELNGKKNKGKKEPTCYDHPLINQLIS